MFREEGVSLDAVTLASIRPPVAEVPRGDFLDREAP